MPSPITAIDHLRVRVPSIATAIGDYSALLGCGPTWQGDLDGINSALFEAGNLALFLQESAESEGLEGVCFRVDSRERLRRRVKNVNLELELEADTDPLSATGLVDTSARLDRLSAASALGLSVSFAERPADHSYACPRAILGLDHVVISSANGDNTALFLGARLGLDMRMDMSRPDWKARLLFFRCGDLIVEVLQSLEQNPAQAEDSFYGLSWRVPNASATRERLLEADFDVSDVRKGRKPCTEVLTVRNRTGGVATLLLQPPA